MRFYEGDLVEGIANGRTYKVLRVETTHNGRTVIVIENVQNGVQVRVFATNIRLLQCGRMV